MAPPAIDLQSVNKTFGRGNKKNLAVHDLSLTIGQGEVFGFLGPNGAGKSTTIKMLLGFLKPDSGSMKVMGATVGNEEYRHHIGYLPEFPFFYNHLTAKETLLLSGRLCGLTREALQPKIELLLERMNLTEATNRRIGGFSKGMKQRLGMANALIHDPSIFIFDEPMSGLDPLGRHMIKNLIIELKGQNKTIFFSSHILSDIESLCDKIGIINKGVLLYNGEIESFIDTGEEIEERFVRMIKEDNDAGPA